MLLPLALILTSTGGGGLFSDEEIPDAVAPAPVAAPAAAPVASSSVAASPSAFDLVVPTPVEAFTPRVRGSVKLETRFALDTSFDLRGEQIFEWTIGGKLELDADLTRSLSAFAAPSFQSVIAVDREGGDREAVYLEVPEAYVSWQAKRFSLRAGALVFGWGASDLIAPNDVLNPQDLRRNVIGSPDETKIPVFAVEAVVSPFEWLTIRGVVEPFFAASRFYLTGWDSGIGRVASAEGLGLPDLDALLGKSTVDRIGDQALVTDRPRDHPGNATYAGRVTFKLDDLDLSLNAVYGWESLPQLRVDPDIVLLLGKVGDVLVNGGELDLGDPELLGAIDRVRTAAAQGRKLLQGGFLRRSLLGFDASYALDPVILKVDVAYTFARTLYTQDFRPVEHPWLNAVVGAEYLSGEELQVIVELFAITVFDIRSNYRLSLIEPIAPPPSMSAEGLRTISLPGAIGVVRYAVLEGDLSFELAGLVTLTRGDVVVLPTIKYRLDDHHRLSLGGVLVEGTSGSYGGIYTNNDQLFVGYTWSP